MPKSVVGLFDDRDAAQQAVQDLIQSGIGRDRISIVANDDSGKTHTHTVDDHGNIAGEGAATGLTTGAVVGGVAGLLIGAGFTVLPIAGFLLAGPIAGLIAGAAAGAATGGILGGLIGLGIPKEHAEVYAEGVRRGGTLVTVQASDDAEATRIHTLLDRDGAVDVEERGAAYRSEGFSGYDAKAQPFTSEQAELERKRWSQPAMTEGANEKLQVVEENLSVGKREVERGGVRVRSYVTEQPVTEQVSLREEHVEVNRRPVDRPVDAGTLNTFEEGTIEIKETAEVPVVAKEARVIEEVAIGKSAEQRTETINDTVRRTNVEVEQIGGDWETDYRSHFSSLGSGGAYEEYAPAYSFGQSMSGSEWDEMSLRDRWESQHPGSWNRFRDSIHYGWNRSRTGAGTNRAQML